MAVTAWHIPAGHVDDATVGTIGWADHSEIEAEDGLSASAVITAEAITKYLKVTDFAFDEFTSSAIIDGIEVGIKKNGSALSNVSDYSFKIVVGGSVAGTDSPAGGVWATVTPTFVTYGGATSLFGLTPTATQVLASSFGCAIAATEALGATAEIDFIRMRIHYHYNGDAFGLLLRGVGTI